MADYSGTPLAKKLGVKEGCRLMLVNAPPQFPAALGLLPVGTIITARAPLDLILFFTSSAPELKKSFAKLAAKLSPAGMLWVAWPKKSSGVATDLSFDVVQQVGLAVGLVDTKICAIDETWSGLKFVIRLKDRPQKVPGKSSL